MNDLFERNAQDFLIFAQVLKKTLKTGVCFEAKMGIFQTFCKK
jgi:hypothetical protein